MGMPSPLPPPRPSPRLPPTMAVPMADTDMVDTTERGPLKPSPTTAMVGMVDTDTAMARGLLTPRLTTVTLATVMVDTMASVPLMPRPSPRLPPTTAVPMADTDMVDTTERGQLRPSPTMAMEAMVDMVDTDTAMARGQLTLTTATPDTDMVDTLTASKMLTSRDSKHPPSQCNTPISKSRHPSQNSKKSEPNFLFQSAKKN